MAWRHPSPRSLMALAGVPMQIMPGGRSPNTLLRAPTTVPSPIHTPGATVDVGREPAATSDCDGLWFQRESRVCVVVCGAAQVRVLADRRVGSNGNGGDAIDVHIIGDGRKFAHRQIPRPPDSGARANFGTIGHGGAKQCEKESSPLAQRSRTSIERAWLGSHPRALGRVDFAHEWGLGLFEMSIFVSVTSSANQRGTPVRSRGPSWGRDHTRGRRAAGAVRAA